jgi:capsular polysaccharide transport system permease protein
MMKIENDQQLEERSFSALEQARNVAQSLSDAARRARFSARSRRAHAAGGFQARRGARIVRLGLLISFALIVAIPSLASAIYYAFIASDQFVAEAKFTVSGGEIPSPDRLGALTGIPAMAIVQDTQIVVNYIQSRAALERLERLIEIRNLYTSPNADWLSRFDAQKPIEKFVKYWGRMIEASIKMPAGIVELKVRAFTPEDSRRIAQTVLSISEALINELNDRMNKDAVSNAEQELNRTTARLTQARIALERARNDDGLLDTAKTAEALNKLITDSRGALLKLQQDYTSQLKWVAESAPQMRALKSRIDAMRDQIAELESKLTTTRVSASNQPTLATTMTKFAELDLERQIAERLYAGAVASLELARLTAEHKMMYINIFVQPVIPEEAQYPKRLLYPCLIFIGLLSLWGISCGLAATIRNHMA